MRTGLVQLDIAWEDVAENHRRAERRVQEAAALGAQLVVLPEMFACGFSMGAAPEAPGGPTESFLAELAQGLGVHVVAGVPLLLGERKSNCAVWTAPDGSVERYAKIHPFSFAREHEHYLPGSRVVTWDIGGLRVSPQVCYDLRFPEPFRLAAADTDAFVVIANWPDRRRAHWQTLLRARAIENQAFVAGVNRVGDGDGLHYAGDSAIVSPWGEALVGGAEQEAVLVADLDPAAIRAARLAFPALRDRRDSYTR
ncbi:MAG: carbon-nitrogen family hydrolase [Deltaproteobacteria bacterium]|nr:carbon-nitrogen family hydrolase [Deltaproteobacteria bacterium]